jgi:hypothetical protein
MLETGAIRQAASNTGAQLLSQCVCDTMGPSIKRQETRQFHFISQQELQQDRHPKSKLRFLVRSNARKHSALERQRRISSRKRFIRHPCIVLKKRQDAELTHRALPIQDVKPVSSTFSKMVYLPTIGDQNTFEKQAPNVRGYESPQHTYLPGQKANLGTLQLSPPLGSEGYQITMQIKPVCSMPLTMRVKDKDHLISRTEHGRPEGVKSTCQQRIFHRTTPSTRAIDPFDIYHVISQRFVHLHVASQPYIHLLVEYCKYLLFHYNDIFLVPKNKFVLRR